jgi:hypothetical protein
MTPLLSRQCEILIARRIARSRKNVIKALSKIGLGRKFDALYADVNACPEMIPSIFDDRGSASEQESQKGLTYLQCIVMCPFSFSL